MDKSAWHRNSYLLWITMRSSGKRPRVFSCVAFAHRPHGSRRHASIATRGPSRGKHVEYARQHYTLVTSPRARLLRLRFGRQRRGGGPLRRGSSAAVAVGHGHAAALERRHDVSRAEHGRP